VFVANFFVFTLRHAMVAAPMRTRFDQFGKQMVRTALETRGPVETDAEVPADTRRIDLWFMPDPARGSVPDHLGVGEVHRFEEPRVKIGNEDVPRWVDTGRKPSSDGAAATTHFKTVPTRTDAQVLQVTYGSGVEGSGQCREAGGCFTASVIENVLRHCWSWIATVFHGSPC